MQAILAPEVCPSCESPLEWKNDMLYCTNILCPAQIQKRIEHFARSLKIKGLGPKSIEKLGLTSLLDIYNLSYYSIKCALSSEKLAIKLLREINHSRKASMNDVLPAFSIPLIGKTAATKLSSKIKSLFDLDEDKCKAAGLGPKATESLLSWYSDEFEDSLKKLPFDWQFQTPKIATETKGAVCISGKLSSFKTKAEATKALSYAGYVVKSSLTKDVIFLVNESGIESAKTKEARERGITIITSLNEWIGD
jgi:NAD-dependent DNA ligase